MKHRRDRRDRRDQVETDRRDPNRAADRRRVGRPQRRERAARGVRRLLAYALLLAVLLGGLARTGTAEAASGVLTEITAVYLGTSLEVGKSIDTKNLAVTAYYRGNNGVSVQTLKSGYTLSPSTVTQAGTNTITVSYNGYTAQVTVIGKSVISLSAEYVGDEITVGGTVSRGNLLVTAYYSDGTSAEISNYTLASATVLAEGDNFFTVTYGGASAEFLVPGKAPLAVEELIAYYDGDEVIVGNVIDKTRVEVIAVYNDGNMETLKNFNLSPSMATQVGRNEIVVSYGGQSTTITVQGIEKEIVSVTARYTGAGVVIGQSVEAADVEVIATYNDGTTGETSAFSLFGTRILAEGENIVLVYCGEFVELITVNGVEGFSISYDNSISRLIVGETGSYTTVTLALPDGLPQDRFEILDLDADFVEQAVYRVVPTDDFIAFHLYYEDDEMVTQFPMAVKVTLPDGYEADRFGVYYTPNQKTIMAKMNGTFVDEERTEYEFIVYEPGAYILVHEISSLLVEEIVVDEELTLRAGRSYSLSPLVLPVKAENRDVTYWSSDEEVATVSATGKIRTYQAGECHIWVESTDGSGTFAIITLYVTAK